MRPGPHAGCCEECQARRRDAASAVVPPSSLRETPTPWYRSWKVRISVLLLAALTGAGIRWRPELLGQYHRWTQNLHARRAVQAFEKKDYEHAILDGRRALEFDPFDVETNRLIAKSREAQGSLEAIAWRTRLNLLRPGDPENAVAWARDALNAGAVEMAEDALAVLKPAHRNTADYHDIAAQIALAKTDSVEAESHSAAAVRLAPASEDFRLRLATLQVQSRTESLRASATKTLLTLAEVPRHRLTALRALIEDAMNHREFPRAREFADQLVASPDARFTERLGRLSLLRTQNAPDASACLEQLRVESLADAEQLSVLLRWMNQNGLPLLVSDWVPALPPAFVAQPPVCLAIADAYGRDRDWPKLRAFVEKAVWKDYEHVRLAHLAHALENFGSTIAAGSTWGRAMTECREKSERLGVLVRLAQAWKADRWAELALRKLSADERSPLWVLDALWDIAKSSGDSEELRRLSRLIVKARPKNPAARNNFIRMSLLRHADEGNTALLAAALFKERPTDITCAVTYALSLFLNGKVYEAMQILRKFPEPELRQPEVALYHGIFLQASGDSASSAEFLKLARGAVILRDEEELIARVKRESRFNTLVPPAKAAPAPEKKSE